MVEPKKDLRRLLFIGSLDVAPTFGGPIQFYRHFVERTDFDFQKLIEPTQPRLAHLFTGWRLVDRIIDRLTRTRYFPHFVALNEWLAVKKAVSFLMREATAYRPDAIVTVGFGAYGFAAAEIARRLKIPLVTFFHDWWPDLFLQSKPGIMAFDWRMRRLYRQSNLALCVCEQMMEELGSHSNAQILYPISRSHVVAPTGKTGEQKRPRVVYLGGMTRAYGRLLSSLSQEFARVDGLPWELAVFGEIKDWPAEEAKAVAASGVYRGTRYGEAAQQELSAADIFLVAMDFEPATRRRVRTSFPSKLLDYCAFGKPIVIWAPEYSSVASFAQRTQLGLIHTDPNPIALIDKINQLIQDPARMREAAETAVKLNKTIFNPDLIHANLVSAVNGLLNGQNGKLAISRQA